MRRLLQIIRFLVVIAVVGLFAALALIVVSFNLLGDWLREALDPRQRQV